jgi:hypothetical protein
MLAAKFPVPMVVGPHPFPFRTRQLSPLTPMVLQPQGCWESRKAPDYSKTRSREIATGFLLFSVSLRYLTLGDRERVAARPSSNGPA